ncbi:MAG: NupC/NupG family nucleoside CNT transporter [Chitinophagales bacterium]
MGETIVSILRGGLGIIFLLAICVLFSSNRKKINWQLVGIGLGLQLLLALAVLKIPFVMQGFDVVSGWFVSILNFTRAGSEFLFAGMVGDMNTFGFIFAFQVLPTIVFFSALSAALYYMGILQWIVYGFAWIMSKTMRLSGAESLAAAGNIFLGQTESPLLVKPYLDKMTKSEIMCLMTGGMATIAGGVLAAYVGFLGGSDPVEQQLFATHLLTASIMSAPAAIVAAKILVPEDKETKVDQTLRISKDKIGTNILDAVSNGTRDGLKLAVNVGAMLLVFTAFMYMFNAIAFGIGDKIGINDNILAATDGRYEGLTLQFILGNLFAPIAWMLGTPSQDIVMVGQLLGEKTILNEFFAYGSLGEAKAGGKFVFDKSVIIATYALCGFANFASIGIQIGGIGSIAPKQQPTLAQLGIKSLIGGTVACFMTAAIAGMLF